MDFLYRFRDWVSLPTAALVLILITTIPIQHGIKQLVAKSMEISLIEIPAPAPTLAPELPLAKPEFMQTKPEPPRAKPDSVKNKRESPQISPPHKVEVKAPAAKPVVVQEEIPIMQASPSSSAPPMLPNPAVSENVAPPPQKTAEVTGLEEGYIAAIRAEVQSRKKYPTGREANLQRPQGTVRACMELDRKGALKGAIDIERSSHSMILDAEAKKLLRTGGYPPFPNGAFPEESTVRLCVNLEYSL